MSAIMTTMTRVNQVYENDVSVRMVLVANNDLVVYTDSGSDPFDNSNTSALLGQAQADIDAKIGDDNYDIGHVFSTASGGLATLNSVCVSGIKSRGTTGISSPIGDPFDIDFVAHELGHQFGGNHTFNGAVSSCSGGNRNGSTAYEPGSGSTIQAYAGICGSDNLQSNSDPMFHHESLVEFIAHITGNGNCATNTSNGNSIPTINAGNDYTIPSNTPFMLTVAASGDTNGDSLTYSWEQRDLGPQAEVSDPDDGQVPLFRTFEPTVSSTRYFPRLPDVLNGTTTIGEQYPTTNRTMNFRCVVRDNRSGGGAINWDDVVVTVVQGSGFNVTAPNSGGSFSGSVNITWNVAGTNAGQVNTPNVDVYLSTDGGVTFPTMLLQNTPNDGTEAVPLPNLSTTTARIMVKGAGNVFYDVNEANFSITPAADSFFSPTGNNRFIENTGNGNGSPEPNESLAVLIEVQNSGLATNTNIMGTLVSNTAGVTINTGTGTQPFPDAAALTGITQNSNPFFITLDSTDLCGSNISFTLQMTSDQGSNNIDLSIPVGITPAPFSFISVDTTVLNDNGNDSLDPGESAEVVVSVQNNSSNILGDNLPIQDAVSGVLSSLSSNLTVTQANSNYPTFNPNETQANSTAYIIQVSEAQNCGEPVSLRLTMLPEACSNNIDFQIPVGIAPAPFSLFSVDTTVLNDNGNNVLDPGESADLVISVRNDSSNILGDGIPAIDIVSGELSSLSPNLTILQANSGFPALNPNETQSNTTAYRIQISEAQECGVPVNLRLTMMPISCSNTLDFTINTGAVPAPTQYSFDSITGSDSPVEIISNSTIDVPLTVSGFSGTVQDLNFSVDGSICNTIIDSQTVGITHSYVFDLDITLISPSGTQVLLVEGIGGNDANDGSGVNICNMVLDDEGSFPSIQTQNTASNAPFTGTWTPNNSLSAFDGENPNGTWTLRVADIFELDSGFVRAWSIYITSTNNCLPPNPDPDDPTIREHLLGITPLTGQDLIDADKNSDGDVNVGDIITNINN